MMHKAECQQQQEEQCHGVHANKKIVCIESAIPLGVINVVWLLRVGCSGYTMEHMLLLRIIIRSE